MPLVDADLLIAAIALEKADLLFTEKTEHFSRIAGLGLANWTG